jgi:hypothetical protein
MNMKKVILLTAVILLSATTFAQAQDGELSGTIDLTFLSQYIWRGFDWFGKDSAIQPSVDLDLYGTGLGMKVLWSKGMGDGNELMERLDLTLYYGNTLYEYETYATKYQVGWAYYYFPDGPAPVTSGNLDFQEFFATLSWPEILPEGIVPNYTIIKMWQTVEGSVMAEISGWLHILGVGYDLPIEGLLPDTPEQILHLSAAMVYNSDVGLTAPSDSDWSHAVFGVSTDFDLGNDLTLTPGVYFQSSWEDDINSSDEFWASVGVSYAF